MLPSKIVSGGQTGADRAALLFAIERRIEPGGWCPQGGRCEGGRIASEDMRRFNLRETVAWGYAERTEFNVRDSDATVIFNRGGKLSPGCDLTVKYCRVLQRPYRVLRLPFGWFEGEADQNALAAAGRAVAEFLAEHQPATLNVAGNREGTTPGIGALVRSIMASAWEQYAAIAAAPVATQDCQHAGQMDFLDLALPVDRVPVAMVRRR